MHTGIYRVAVSLGGLVSTTALLIHSNAEKDGLVYQIEIIPAKAHGLWFFVCFFLKSEAVLRNFRVS